MGLIERLRRSGHIHDQVCDLFRNAGLESGRVLDIPGGDGVNAKRLAEGGYEVHATDFDLSADRTGYSLTCCDMTSSLPFADDSFDGVLHSEGIEHVDNQLSLLTELARVLRPGGVLVVTTPNIMHLEGRLSTLLCGHAHPRRDIVAHPAAYWGATGKHTYYGHVFLINSYQLRFYLTEAGLDIRGVDTARYSRNAVLLAPLLWLPVQWLTRRTIRHGRTPLPEEIQERLISEVLSPALLYGRKLIMVATKPVQPVDRNAPNGHA